MKAVIVLCLVLLVAQATCQQLPLFNNVSYSLSISSVSPLSSEYILKQSSVVKYSGELVVLPIENLDCDSDDNRTAIVRFCASRSFVGSVSGIDLEGNTTSRLLTDDEGCLTIFSGSIELDGFTGLYKQPIPEFDWNAQGGFYLNGFLESENNLCGSSIQLKIEGKECDQNAYSNGGPCLSPDAYAVPTDTVKVVSGEGGLTFAVESPIGVTRLGQLTMLLDVDADVESVGLPSEDLGYVRLLLNGIPNENDLDFEVPLVAPQTELSIASMRSFSTYFYSVVASPEAREVFVNVENITTIDCDGEMYGPNCSVTSKSLGNPQKGQKLTINVTNDPNCQGNVCFFSLVDKTVPITVASGPKNVLESWYKSGNFPTRNDFDVKFTGNTTFLPDELQTPPMAYFAVSLDYTTEKEATFELTYGISSPPPPPPPSPSDDDLPWAWIGVAIALGAISLALIVGFAIYTYTNKQYQQYELVES